MQYKHYLKGFFFQSHGCRGEAIKFYKKSLMSSDEKSWNWCRQACLENLQLYNGSDGHKSLRENELICSQLRKHVV